MPFFSASVVRVANGRVVAIVFFVSVHGRALCQQVISLCRLEHRLPCTAHWQNLPVVIAVVSTALRTATTRRWRDGGGPVSWRFVGHRWLVN